MNRPGEHDPTFQEQGGRTETSGVVGTVTEKARDLASGATEAAGQAWESTKRHTREWASTAADTAQDAYEGFGNFIRRYPVASLLGALGVGFLLGGALAATTRRYNYWS
jgi:hypothetical protein